MIVPAVILNESPRGRSSRLLRASEILSTAFRESMSSVAGMPMDDLTKSIVSRGIRETLSRQFQLRGFSAGGANVVWMELDVVESSDGYTLMFDPGWTKQVDFLLGNRDCPRCGSLTVAGVPHPQEDCDLVVVRDVIES